ncbi:MAG: M20/M25/M40 family metallo-hydrolase [Actinomycetota bacterium]
MAEQVNEQLLEELIEWLRIPSISSGGGDPADLQRAAEWAANKIQKAGGEAEVVATETNPLVIGELRAARSDAPTVMIYGHYDVQSADPLDAWESPPFQPQVRNGRLYGRGTADDKGNFFPLLHVACEMAQNGELPVNVRVIIEGEEEVGGDSAANWVIADERGADCAIIFDSEMLDEETPAICLGVRGIVTASLTVRTGRANLHSGLYGGAVLNALHVLHNMLAQVLPGPDGKLRKELRVGVVPPSPEEIESWKSLPSPAQLFEDAGGRPIHAASADTYYEQNWSDASLDVSGIDGGDAHQLRTIIPVEAHARLNMRLAPSQDFKAMKAELERLLMSAAPENADVEFSAHGEAGAVFDAASPAIQLASEALTEACGTETVLIGSGGSIGALAGFARRGIPCVLTGFTLVDDALHAPNESYRLESLRLGEKSARLLYEKLATLKS